MLTEVKQKFGQSVSPYLQCGRYDVQHFHWLISNKSACH